MSDQAMNANVHGEHATVPPRTVSIALSPLPCALPKPRTSSTKSSKQRCGKTPYAHSRYIRINFFKDAAWKVRRNQTNSSTRVAAGAYLVAWRSVKTDAWKLVIDFCYALSGEHEMLWSKFRPRSPLLDGFDGHSVLSIAQVYANTNNLLLVVLATTLTSHGRVLVIVSR